METLQEEQRLFTAKGTQTVTVGGLHGISASLCRHLHPGAVGFAGVLGRQEQGVLVAGQEGTAHVALHGAVAEHKGFPGVGARGGNVPDGVIAEQPPQVGLTDGVTLAVDAAGHLQIVLTGGLL